MWQGTNVYLIPILYAHPVETPGRAFLHGALNARGAHVPGPATEHAWAARVVITPAAVVVCRHVQAPTRWRGARLERAGVEPRRTVFPVMAMRTCPMRGLGAGRERERKEGACQRAKQQHDSTGRGFGYQKVSGLLDFLHLVLYIC